MPKRLINVLPYALLTTLILVVFRELAFTDRILGRGDTFLYFYPYWTVRDDFFRAGELPLWTPNIFMGAPLLANPQLGALYPPNWLTIGLDAPNAIRISILLHIAWATLGSYLLARCVVHLRLGAAVVTAALFGLGGYVSAHVEQINQLQGLSWFPWLFVLLHLSLVGDSASRPYRWIILLGGAIALQVLSGHTQTVFISGVGMALYGFAAVKPTRTVLVLGSAGVIALLLASPQLVPTYELVGESSRSGGLDVQAALSFSLNPFIAGRGLLPSYDGKIFSEYIAYIGVIGFVLAVIGAWIGRPAGSSPQSTFPHRRVWLVILLAGLFLAVGAYNPINWWIVRLPGFDLFRVPARWLALYGLGAAVLAGMGTEALSRRTVGIWRVMLLPLILILALGGASFLAGRVPEEVNGSAIPTLTTILAWGAALVAIVAIVVAPQRFRILIVPIVLIELVASSWVMPYNDLVPPEVWHGQRFTISQMLAYTETDENGLTAEGTPPGRVLSISGLLFDPGDKATLSARYQELGMTPLEERYSFVAAKMKETLTPNLPLAWGIPSVDGYDGGLLPTKHYNTFMELVYPDGVDVPGDGRLQENLALEACRGACILPELTSTIPLNLHYALVDKVFDVWRDDVAFDSAFRAESFKVSQPFMATEARILHICNSPGEVCRLTDTWVFADFPDPAVYSVVRHRVTGTKPLENGLQLTTLQFIDLKPVDSIGLSFDSDVQIYAITLVDERTGQFYQMSANSWRRVLSSDVKLYETFFTSAYAVKVSESLLVTVEDDNEAIDLLHSNAANLVVHTDEELALTGNDEFAEAHDDFYAQYPSGTTFTYQLYTPSRIELTSAIGGGMLVIPESYYPGWRATVNGEPTPIYRANINFRAVPLPAGESHVIFEYKPWWLPGIFIFGLLAWAFAGFTLLLTRRKRK